MPKETIINLPSVPHEYIFLAEYRCKHCGSKVKGERYGCREASERFEDVWEVTCEVCKRSEVIVLSVPSHFPKEVQDKMQAVIVMVGLCLRQGRVDLAKIAVKQLGLD